MAVKRYELVVQVADHDKDLLESEEGQMDHVQSAILERLFDTAVTVLTIIPMPDEE